MEPGMDPLLSFLPKEAVNSVRREVPGGEPGDITCDVVIIGAGVSGLTATSELLKRVPEMNVCIVEANERVGGRTLTTQMRVKDGGTDAFDLGGQWVATAQTEIMETLEELGLEVYRQREEGATQVQVGGTQVRRIGTIPNIGSFWGVVQLVRLARQLDWLAVRCAPGSSTRERWMRNLKGTTVESFTRQYVSSEPALELVGSLCRTEFGCEPSRVGLFDLLSDVQSAGGLKGVQTTNEFKVKGGTQQISERLADRVGRHRIHMRHPVTGVIHRQDGSVTVTTAPGTNFHCKYVIASIPPNQLVPIRFDPPLSPIKQEMNRSVMPGNLIKFLVTFEKAFWRDAGLSGMLLSGGREPDSIVSAVMDGTSSNDSPALVGFISGEIALRWQGRTKAERENAVIAHLIQFFGQEVNHYIEYQEKVWAEHPYGGGAPACCMGPGLTAFKPAQLEPHGSVHFCGADVSPRWAGFMSGAVASGRRAAFEVLYCLRPGALRPADLEVIGKRRPVWLQAESRPVSKPSSVWGELWQLAIRPFVVLFLIFVNRQFLGGGLASLGVDM